MFQSVELREPSKEAVLGFNPGDNIPRAAVVHYRQNKNSFRSVVNLSNGTFSSPVAIPRAKASLGSQLANCSTSVFWRKTSSSRLRWRSAGSTLRRNWKRCS